jgi:hypothetical protein
MVVEKEPTPLPTAILLSLIVGVPVVFQHIPRSVTVAPPSVGMEAEQDAVVAVRVAFGISTLLTLGIAEVTSKRIHLTGHAYDL